MNERLLAVIGVEEMASMDIGISIAPNLIEGVRC